MSPNRTANAPLIAMAHQFWARRALIAASRLSLSEPWICEEGALLVAMTGLLLCELFTALRFSFSRLQWRGGGLGFLEPQAAGAHSAPQAESAGEERDPEPQKRDHDRRDDQNREQGDEGCGSQKKGADRADA